MRSRVAVVIPVFNREKLVIRALESALGQTMPPSEVIVVDNGSTDNSYREVERWMNSHRSDEIIFKLIKESVPGAATARNAGLDSVVSDYVYFLDSDDCMDPELIQDVSTAIVKNDNPDLVCWWAAVSTPTGVRRRGVSHKDMFKAQIYQARICTQTFVARTDFIKKAGGWNSSLLCWDDWELGIRLLCRSPKIAFVDKVLTIIYPQTVSITGENHYSKAGEWERAIDVAEADVEGLPDEKKLRGMINYRRLNLAALYKREGRRDLAEPLRQKALRHHAVNRFRRMVLNLIYHYTAGGGRGGYLIYDVISDK